MSRFALLALALSTAPLAPLAAVPVEQQVLDALNAARTNPGAFAEALRKYKAGFKGKVVAIPGSSERVETEEGVAAVDETIAFLDSVAPMPAAEGTLLLATAASDHVVDQTRTGQTGHAGSDGSTPSDRVRKRGGGPYAAEVIAYGPIDGIDTVRQLIVDDGVADRGHRAILFSPELRYAGVSCGRHPEYRTVCVIDLGMTPDGTLPRSYVGRTSVPR